MQPSPPAPRRQRAFERGESDHFLPLRAGATDADSVLYMAVLRWPMMEAPMAPVM